MTEKADFERRVLSCLSPVTVEEGDAKAVGPWHGMASAPRDGTYILASGLDFGAGPRRHFTVCLCLEGTDTFVEAEGGEELTYLDAWVPLPGAALLSTHTAAGAGPVGEAVSGINAAIAQAWDCLVNVDDRSSPEEYPDMCLITVEELGRFMRHALYARPVEEPGEVERLTRADFRAILADRASQEERIREDERDRLLERFRHDREVNAYSIGLLVIEGAMPPIDRARQRGDAS